MTWVALVERGGNCSFVAKVRNMQESGAAAVIVGDNQRNGLITMYARGKDPIFLLSVCNAASFFYCISCVYASCLSLCVSIPPVSLELDGNTNSERVCVWERKKSQGRIGISSYPSCGRVDSFSLFFRLSTLFLFCSVYVSVRF